MNGHLSEEQFDRWLAGERALEVERHVRECRTCQAEVTRLENTFAAFRGAVCEWSGTVDDGGRDWRVERVVTVPRRGGRLMGLRLLVAAALLMAVTVTWYVHSRVRERAAETARADAVLLEQIDAEISRAVPQPMEPLVQMVSWGPGTAEGKN